MRIALLNPPWYDPRNPQLWGVRAGSRWPHFQKRAASGALPRYIPFPFFLAIAAHSLQDHDHDILLLDGVAENLMLPDFLSRVEAFQPDAIFAETSTPSLRWDLDVMRQLRERLPGVQLGAGGTHAACLVPDLLAREGLPDFWIAGEYEESLTRWAAGERDIPGLIDKDRHTVSPARIDDVNRLPAPLFEQLPVRHYGDPVCGLPRPGAQSWLSRGCPYGCTFCVWPQVMYGDRRYRRRHIAAALAEVRQLIDTYGCESFYFDDDTANIGEDRMKELAAGIKNNSLHEYPWAMMARADCMTPPMIDALADAGLYSIKYGVESSSPELLDACHKGTDLEKMKASIRRTREAGVKIHLTFTFGMPGETRDTIRETLAFALETAPESAQFSLCTPFPGTVFYEDCRANGRLTTEDWSRFLGSDEAVVSTPQLSADALMEEYAAAVAAWNVFAADRLAARKQTLLSRLREAVQTGPTWTLLGDRDFADFLLKDKTLRKAFHETPDEAALAVIVSRHDEEKIARSLLRSSPSRNILRLYG